MKRLKAITAIMVLSLVAASCGSYGAYQKARTAETEKNWDRAVVEYEKALEIDPDNTQYRVSLDRAKRESSREHFEKGKTMRAAALNASPGEQHRLLQLAANELQMTVRLDPTNQYAAVELSKALQAIDEVRRAANELSTTDDMKRRAKANVTKAQPPQLDPASNDPITLTFPRETPVKEIYRALGNAFGINILFDQAVKDDRVSIELRDVTAQQALERVMQAANHFYKVLDEKTLIVVPDNPQARRDYEDLVIQTFYLSNGDAEQVTNVVRTMIEARNVFPLKALNAITIRDTADKVRIAEKIIEANDKAKAEVVVSVELVQLDLSRVRDLGFAISGPGAGTDGGRIALRGNTTNDKGEPIVGAVTGGTFEQLSAALAGGTLLNNHLSFTLPQASYSLLKTLGNSELLASPELRISEGEKATLHIGQRIPVPVSTFQSVGTAPGTGGGTFSPVTSYQYQDVGIKVAMEPRVHHNREVTLKLTVEVSNVGARIENQPTFATRTIESTIRLKDGETNFLAGLIQRNQEVSDVKTPFLGDLPFIGRLFTNSHRGETRTDLVLTMTPHIIRIANITDDDLAPMWVGTTNNLTFRGVSPRIESQSGVDPFNGMNNVSRSAATNSNSPQTLQLSSDGEPGNFISPEGNPAPAPVTPPGTPVQGSAPSDPFRQPPTTQPPTPPAGSGDTVPQSPWTRKPPGTTTSNATDSSPASAMAANVAAEADVASLRMAPRLSPQPTSISLTPGQSRLWTIVGMDLDGLSTSELLIHFNARAMDVTDAAFGPAIAIDPATPPIVTINRDAGTIRITSSNGKPLSFVSGGEVLSLRVHGGLSGETFLVLENPTFRNAAGGQVVAAVTGGRARIQ